VDLISYIGLAISFLIVLLDYFIEKDEEFETKDDKLLKGDSSLED